MIYHLKKRLIAITLVLVTLTTPSLLFQSASARSQPSEERGAMGLGQAIKRLGVVASLLHTGAHPDDEDSGLLAYLARGRQARTAYLSLTRGDGGQNLIGSELYESLGIIRTEELAAARRLDGAQQFFSRAYDFGFSKSRDEALAKWDREAVLADMVRVIRTFRPLVILSQWSGTPTDGHGHHQAAGFLTFEAYRAAADPARYPDQIASGLRPWKARKIYAKAESRRGAQSAEHSPEYILSVNTGQFDPLFGRSYYEIAMQGRSQHRSQDQGAIERRGPQFSRLKLLESNVDAPRQEKDIFDGIDSTLVGIAQFADRPAPQLGQALSEVQRAADEAKERFNPLLPSAVSPVIARGLKKLRETRLMVENLKLGESANYDIDFLLKQKEEDFVDALARAEGIVIDCLADDEVVTPGQTFGVSVTAFANAASSPVSITLESPAGWSVAEQKKTSSIVEGRLVSETNFRVTVADEPEFTESYWLRQSRKGDLYIPGKGATGIEPQGPPPLIANVVFEIGGEKISLRQPAQFRFADKALGEIRRELKVAPKVSVTLSPTVLIFPVSAKPVEREVTVSLTNNAKEGASGMVRLDKSLPWAVTPEAASFELKREGERASFSFSIKVPANASETQTSIRATATVDGRQYTRGYQAISYPHVETRFRYRDAVASAKVFDVKVAAGLKVGFIEGAGDDFANALRLLDVDVKLIDPQVLASGDLSQFDVIVTGVRAYEVRQDLIANNQRLLEYVNRGGTLIVQYNKIEIVRGNFAPYPVKMKESPNCRSENSSPECEESRRNPLKFSPDRVTDERAKVTLLDPAHARFNYPNRITDRDFEGWIQERGAYFFSGWDPRFKPLMASSDPGEEPKQGGELIAQYGRGLFVYTAYAWFRQLPEGVPGAYRLIANLVSLPKAKPMRNAR